MHTDIDSQRRRFVTASTAVVGAAGVPAPTNLVVPRYRFASDSLIEIGTDETPA